MALGNVDHIFGCYAIVERSTGLTVSTIGFFGAPDAAGTVMIGYGLVPSARGAGFPAEALLKIVEFSFAQEGVVRLEADPDRDNVAHTVFLRDRGSCGRAVRQTPTGTPPNGASRSLGAVTQQGRPCASLRRHRRRPPTFLGG
jgi:Acetyltransferase (GNAT) domain